VGLDPELIESCRAPGGVPGNSGFHASAAFRSGARRLQGADDEDARRAAGGGDARRKETRWQSVAFSSSLSSPWPDQYLS
jgi:hypothetical protein